ncbi:MAG: hypothetical protein ACKO0N_02430 [Planctomycetota bacterium]
MIALKLDKPKLHYDIDEPIVGEVIWDGLTERCDLIELRLLWYTSGKGDRDLLVIARIAVMKPGVSGKQRFHFDPPGGPYSFSGALISLVWAIEAVTVPLSDSQIIEFTLAPSGNEVRIGATSGINA